MSHARYLALLNNLGGRALLFHVLKEFYIYTLSTNAS